MGTTQMTASTVTIAPFTDGRDNRRLSARTERTTPLNRSPPPMMWALS
jgi:hypothetical protein